MHQDFLAALQCFLNEWGFRATAAAVAAVAIAVSIFLGWFVDLVIFVVFIFRLVGGLSDEIRGVEKGALLRTDVDEGCLDSGEHRVDPAKVNVTDHASVVWTIDEKLDELPVLQNRDPRFTRSRVYEDFSFHCCRLTTPHGDSASEVKDGSKKSARSCYRAAL